MRKRAQWYVAGVALTFLDFICHLTNHVGGCWLSFRGPFKPLHDWAFEVLNPIDETSARFQNGHARGTVPVEVTEHAPICGVYQSGCTTGGDHPPHCTLPAGHGGNFHTYERNGWSVSWYDANLEPWIRRVADDYRQRPALPDEEKPA